MLQHAFYVQSVNGSLLRGSFRFGFGVVCLFVAGCLETPASDPMGNSEASAEDAAHWIHTLPGLEPRPLALASSLPTLRYTHVGASASEPTLGVTKEGRLFFTGNAIQLPAILRSDDGGATWESIANPPFTMPTGLDAYLWIDPETQRIFVDSLWVGCSYLSWSDDDGETWTPNPVACGSTLNDHQKITTGKFRPGGILDAGLYPNVVYFGYNQFFGNDQTGNSRISMSFDGGLTWPYNRESIPGSACSEGLHGRIRTDSEGLVFIPKRDCDGTLMAISKDNGLTWDHVKVGEDVGSTDFRKNHEMAIDRNDILYLVWAGPDNRLYLATSQDHGETWSKSIAATPPEVTTATMPAVVAGDAGRIAFAYYGVLHGNGKNPECVGNDENWDVLVTWSLDALSDSPSFVTTRANRADDPVQIGGISTLGLELASSDLGPDCAYRRNLADFIDAIIDTEGRVYAGTSDGCMGCTDHAGSTSAQGAVSVQVGGPSLFVDQPEFVGPPAGYSR